MLNVTGPLVAVPAGFDTVMVCVPTSPENTEPNGSVAGALSAAGATPRPVMLIEVAPPGVADTAMVPFCVPVVVGRNFTWIVQEAVAASVVQLFEMTWNCEAPMLTLIGPDAGEFAGLVTVNVSAVDAVPVAHGPKSVVVFAVM